jgi:hypothetical protein
MHSRSTLARTPIPPVARRRMPGPYERLPLPHDVRHSLLANNPHRGIMRMFLIEDGAA